MIPFFFRNMWILVTENHSSTLMSIKVDHGTQKVKKVKKIEMSHRSIETHFQCHMVNIHRVIEQKHTF